MDDWTELLRREHAGDAATFLFQLRSGPGWDHDAFARLFAAMCACCRSLEGEESIPRWIAELFWRLDWYVRQEVDRRWGDGQVPDDYQNASTNLNHLAHWIFTGEARSDDAFEPLRR